MIHFIVYDFSQNQMKIKNANVLLAQVEKNDKTTTTIDICFEKINDFVHFHKICDATSIQMRISMGLSNEADKATSNAADEMNAVQPVTTETQTMPIEIVLPENRPSTAKRRNTEMDLSDWET